MRNRPKVHHKDTVEEEVCEDVCKGVQKPDGQKCGTECRWVDDGEGSEDEVCEKVCEMKYKTVTECQVVCRMQEKIIARYEDWCEYDINLWTPDHDNPAKAQGTDANPRWPPTLPSMCNRFAVLWFLSCLAVLGSVRRCTSEACLRNMWCIPGASDAVCRLLRPRLPPRKWSGTILRAPLRLRERKRAAGVPKDEGNVGQHARWRELQLQRWLLAGAAMLRPPAIA